MKEDEDITRRRTKEGKRREGTVNGEFTCAGAGQIFPWTACGCPSCPLARHLGPGAGGSAPYAFTLIHFNHERHEKHEIFASNHLIIPLLFVSFVLFV
ncbi:MAG: hypothetical protein LBQ35_00495, partial [Spirochaetaceae bacterium]|nr:hypothetical protein [Spirochaetaceae bacterium]